MTTQGKPKHIEPPAVGVHLWQIQWVRDVFVIFLVYMVFHLGYLMRLVTVPLLAGLLLAYLFKPIVDRLERVVRRDVGAGILVVAMYIVVGVPLVAATGVAVVQGAKFVHELRKDWPELVQRAEKFIRKWEGEPETPPTTEPGPGSGATPQTPPNAPAGSASPPANGEAKPGAAAPPVEIKIEPPAAAGERSRVSAREAIEMLLGESGGSLGKSIAGGGKRAFEIGWAVIGTAGFLAFNVFFLVPFFFYFCSVGFGRVQRLGVSLIPKHNREKTLDILRKMDDVISGFVRGRVLISCIMGVLFTIGWWAVGVPAPLLLGPIVGALAIVPYLALIGWPTAVIVMWIDQSGAPHPLPAWQILLLPTAVYWVVQWLDDYLMTPLIQGKRTGLDTPMILVAVLGAASLAGVYGVLVAIPAAACIKILVTDVFWPRYKQWAEGKVEDPLPIGTE